MNKKTTTLSVFFLILLMGPIQAMAEITLGVFPRRPVATTHKIFKPLVQKLSEDIGEPVKLVVAKDFKAFWAGVKNKEYDLVHYNQYHYVKSHKEQGYKVIVANEEFGNRDIAGALVVRKDSGISSIAGLKGKTILFGGGRKAMGSFIAPTAALKQAGLKEGRDYTAKFAKNPPSSVIGVYHNAADSAGAGSVILKIKGVTKKVDTSQMTTLATSERFTHLPWAVKGDMPAAKAGKIQNAMIALADSADGKAVLKAAKVTGFFKVTDADYHKVREITEYAVGEKY